MGRLIGCKILGLNLGGFMNFMDTIIESSFIQTSFFLKKIIALHGHYIVLFVLCVCVCGFASVGVTQ